MIKKFFYFITIVTIFISCTKKIEIELPNQKPKLSIKCTFVPFTLPSPRVFIVEVFQSTSILDTLSNTKIDYANVEIFTNNTLVAKIPYDDSLGYYQLFDFHPEKNNKYYIQVEAEGFDKVYAEDIIPSKVFVKDTTIIPFAYVDNDGFIYSELRIKFDDPPNEKNYYEIFFEPFNDSYWETLYSDDQVILSENYYPKLFTLGVQYPKYLPFSDALFNGQEYELSISYFTGEKADNSTVNNSSVYHLVFRSVSKEYYKYRTSLLEYHYNENTDILFGQNEHMNIYSNVQNGYGIFAGYQEEIVTYIVDSIAF